MQFVAFLRGIAPTNPNMHNVKLRGVFESLQFSNVRSVITSGNIIFESSLRNQITLENTIEKALARDLGLVITTIVRSKDQLDNLVARNPFGSRRDSRASYFNVTFLKHIPEIDPVVPFRADNGAYEYVDYFDGALATIIDLTGFHTPDLMTKLEKQFGKAITTRTWKTVHRILVKMNTDEKKETGAQRL